MTSSQKTAILMTLNECQIHLQAARKELKDHNKQGRSILGNVTERRKKHASFAQEKKK